MAYEADACATKDGVTVGEATHGTGFAELDRVASHFECEVEQTLL